MAKAHPSSCLADKVTGRPQQGDRGVVMQRRAPGEDKPRGARLGPPCEGRGQGGRGPGRRLRGGGGPRRGSAGKGRSARRPTLAPEATWSRGRAGGTCVRARACDPLGDGKRFRGGRAAEAHTGSPAAPVLRLRSSGAPRRLHAARRAKLAEASRTGRPRVPAAASPARALPALGRHRPA